MNKQGSPLLLLICGPNGAGKSTLSRTIAMRENMLVIDPDQLAISELSQIAAGKAAIRIIRTLLEERVSFAKESTLTSQFDFDLIKKAKNLGYKVELIYIRLTSPALALERVAFRKARGGHDVPVKDVMRRFHSSLANLEKAIRMVDKYSILDNSTSTYKL